MVDNNVIQCTIYHQRKIYVHKASATEEDSSILYI